MKKETVVEWLEQEFIKLEQTTGVFGVMYDLIEQVKEMEKDQMKDAALSNVTKNHKLRKIFENQFEQYYNETYGK
jgi:hypothetical protein